MLPQVPQAAQIDYGSTLLRKIHPSNTISSQRIETSQISYTSWWKGLVLALACAATCEPSRGIACAAVAVRGLRQLFCTAAVAK